MEEFYLPSNGAGRIHCALWTPETAPRAVVQIIHGIAEHIGRYGHFANFLTERGFAVCADDHMGHGLPPQKGHAPCDRPNGASPSVRTITWGMAFLWRKAAHMGIFTAAGWRRSKTSGRSLKR